ncbi:hypothetical protein M440DRAFT_316478 [Trichoderma longibrachiatum ATCC 18648]|uniref:Uncharacterized protein n=1 Tax=Trichoderma longibrachiatum ATCC 18648 TaxID=983965 RepID=A0A2T4C3V8_TRILO|nr:hypothetical protein M440DRAFT_316478 [Trichoderma longibrachiatum ATCC 18648]
MRAGLPIRRRDPDGARSGACDLTEAKGGQKRHSRLETALLRAPASWSLYGASKCVCLEVNGALESTCCKPSGDMGVRALGYTAKKRQKRMDGRAAKHEDGGHRRCGVPDCSTCLRPTQRVLYMDWYEDASQAQGASKPATSAKPLRIQS